MKSTKTSTIFHSFVFVAVVLLVFAKVSVAEDHRPMPGSGGEKHERGACAEDVKKFCQDVKPGEGRIMECLKQHQNDLSPACKKEGEVMKERFEAAKKACEADVQKYCKGIEPGGGRIISCLKEHEADLSASCKNTFEQGKHSR